MSADEDHAPLAQRYDSGKFTQLDEPLYRYILEHGAREDEALAAVREETAAMGDIAVMQIAPEQGAFLTMLARLIGATEALELGTFTGYSAICIARGLAPAGRLVCCELSEEYAEIAARNLERAGVAGSVEIRIGRALETLSDMPRRELFDLVFIDADKETYPRYYEEVLPRLRAGGIAVLDNVLLRGRVLDPDPDDERARIVAELNRRIAADQRVDAVMLAVADGITLARKR
jgi:caffeoyl-CoA O-methyltransferase